MGGIAIINYYDFFVSSFSESYDSFVSLFIKKEISVKTDGSYLSFSVEEK
jgi:hypothetical protein